MRTRLEPRAGWAETDWPGQDTHWGAGRAQWRAALGRVGGMAWGVQEVGFSQK